MEPTAESLETKEQAKKLAEDLSGEMFELCRALHNDPELSLEETRACRRLTEALSREGFRIEAGVADLPTSFVATTEGKEPGPCVAILAEYDALPEVGHGCGHNLVAASALGAGTILSRLRARLPGQIRIIGTPAEETVGGKARMVKKGIFRSLDAALMIHPGTEFRVNTASLASQSIQVVFEGKSSHAVSAPELGVNALDPLVRLYLGVDAMRKDLTPEVRIPGVILEGGRRPNIVPDRAVGHFSIRARNRAAVEAILERIVRMAQELAAACGARATVIRTDEGYDEMVTNGVLAGLFRRNLVALGARVNDAPRKRMGSLDMGNVSQVVPSLHAYVAVAPETAALHTREFAEASVSEQGRRGLLLAMQALSMTAVDLLADPGAIPAARREFLATTGRGGM